MLIILYLLMSFLIGLFALFCSCEVNESIGIFFDSRKWRNPYECFFALFLGYIFMLPWGIGYWIYKFCTIGRDKQ